MFNDFWYTDTDTDGKYAFSQRSNAHEKGGTALRSRHLLAARHHVHPMRHEYSFDSACQISDFKRTDVARSYVPNINIQSRRLAVSCGNDMIGQIYLPMSPRQMKADGSNTMGPVPFSRESPMMSGERVASTPGGRLRRRRVRLQRERAREEERAAQSLMKMRDRRLESVASYNGKPQR